MSLSLKFGSSENSWISFLVLQISKMPTTEEGRLRRQGLRAKGVDYQATTSAHLRTFSSCARRASQWSPPPSFSPQFSWRRHPAGFYEPRFVFPALSAAACTVSLPSPRRVIQLSASRPATPAEKHCLLYGQGDPRRNRGPRFPRGAWLGHYVCGADGEAGLRWQ